MVGAELTVESGGLGSGGVSRDMVLVVVAIRWIVYVVYVLNNAIMKVACNTQCIKRNSKTDIW